MNEVVYDFTLENMNIGKMRLSWKSDLETASYSRIQKILQFAVLIFQKRWLPWQSRIINHWQERVNWTFNLEAAIISLLVTTHLTKYFASMSSTFGISRKNIWAKSIGCLNPAVSFLRPYVQKKRSVTLPAADYGFTLYNEAEWRTVLEHNNFTFAGAKRKKEAPHKVIRDDPTPHEILCLIAKNDLLFRLARFPGELLDAGRTWIETRNSTTMCFGRAIETNLRNGLFKLTCLCACACCFSGVGFICRSVLGSALTQGGCSRLSFKNHARQESLHNANYYPPVRKLPTRNGVKFSSPRSQPGVYAIFVR